MKRNPPAVVVGTATAAVGAALLGRPQQVARIAAGSTPDAPPGWILQVLGVRYLVQAAAELGRPTRGVWAVVSAVDSIHAVSMIAAAVHWPAYRRPALLNAAAASGSAAITAALARSS